VLINHFRHQFCLLANKLAEYDIPAEVVGKIGGENDLLTRIQNGDVQIVITIFNCSTSNLEAISFYFFTFSHCIYNDLNITILNT
jgi:hypothetical protein